MNKKRRTAVKDVCSQLKLIKEQLSDIQYEEQDVYDNIPDNLLETDAAEESGEAIDKMEEAADYIDDAIDCLQELV